MERDREREREWGASRDPRLQPPCRAAHPIAQSSEPGAGPAAVVESCSTHRAQAPRDPQPSPAQPSGLSLALAHTRTHVPAAGPKGGRRLSAWPGWAGLGRRLCPHGRGRLAGRLRPGEVPAGGGRRGRRGQVGAHHPVHPGAWGGPAVGRGRKPGLGATCGGARRLAKAVALCKGCAGSRRPRESG